MTEEKKPQRFMTREEKAELWRQFSEKNARTRLQNRGKPVELKEWSIVYHDGEPFTQCPWDQLLPTSAEALYFWEWLQELRAEMTDERQAEFLQVLGREDEQSKSLLSAFCAFAMESARESAKQKERAYMESVEVVRQSIDFYEENE